ncbi:MAG: Protein-tyrosine-phosphatase [Solirubrobacterales bacterium]|nr:Protein-tyrosine-phosphatase [Solirubrobacterales bacterium]
MIDLHSHILPGIDDGAPDMAASLEFARAAVAAGTTRIAATPHIDSRYGLGPDQRDAALSEVRAALAAEQIPLDVLPGGEIALERYLDLGEADLARLRLGDGEFLLLEAPLSSAAGGFDRFLAGLLTKGVRMLIAHPERCPDFQRRPERLEALVRSGALAQVTSASLSGRFGSTVQDAALHMLAEGLVHDICSDSHDATRRGPDLNEGLEAAERELPGAHALADWLSFDVPNAIVTGGEIPRRPPVVLERARKRTRLFGRKR